MRGLRGILSIHAAICMFFLLFPLFVSLSVAQQGESDITSEAPLFQEIPSVYSASKYEQKVTEAPASVTIVTADEIKKYGYRTLADILRNVRGFNVTYDRNYSYSGVRGFNRPGDYNSRILLMVDGHRMNDNIFDQVSLGTDFILDVDLISRVEIVRGPSSSIYGSNAFFGVINVITKRGRDIQTAEVAGQLQTLGADHERVTFGRRLSQGAEFLVSATHNQSDGQGNLYYPEYDDPATNFGNAENMDGDKHKSVFGRGGYGNLTVSGGYVDRAKTVPTGAFGVVFNDSRNGTIDKRGYLDLNYRSKLPAGWDLLARANYDYYDFTGDYVFTGETEDETVVNRDRATGEWTGGELQFTRRFSHQKLVAGTEGQLNFKQMQQNFDVSPYSIYLDDNRDSYRWAVYLQDEVQILKNLSVHAGARYDYYDTFGGEFHPRIAVLYNPIKTGTMKGLYGEAFRAPNAFELYYQDGGFTSKSNPDIKPEKIRTYELVYEQYLGSKYVLTANGFHYNIDHLISQVVDPADELLVYQNIDKVTANGLELQLDANWHNGLEGSVSATFQQAKDDLTGEILSNSPRRLVTVNLIVPLLTDRLSAGVSGQYVGTRNTLSGNSTDSYFLANINFLLQRIARGLEISAGVYNLFDQKYADPASGEHLQDALEQDGRTFGAKILYRF